MEPQFAPARSPHARAVWEEVLRPLAAELQAGVGPLAVDVVQAIREEFPELFEQPGSFEENVRATESNLALFAELLDRGLDPHRADLPAASGAFARAAVERGMPLTGALRSLRLGHAVLWNRMLPLLRLRTADADQLELAVDLASAWSFALVDALSVLAERAYESERERWLRSASALQAEAIDRLLSGAHVDADTASGRLRYELRRTHLALLAWIENSPVDQDPLRLLEDAIARVAAALSPTRPLVQARGTHIIAGWVGSTAGFDAAAIEQLRLDARTDGSVRMALGTPLDGPPGFRESYHQATLARRVALLGNRPAGTITRYGQVALVSLATADLDQASAFVRDVLGPLEPVDDLTRRIAGTLRAFLQEDSSHSRAAKRLGIHENTVRYRIRQAEELLGRELTTGSLELQVALRIASSVAERPEPATATT